MTRKAISILIVLAVLGVPAFAWVPTVNSPQHGGGCHEQSQPTPQPASSICCQTGHRIALVQSPLQWSLQRVSIAADDTEIIAPMPCDRPHEIFPVISPPVVTLRI